MTNVESWLRSVPLAEGYCSEHNLVWVSPRIPKGNHAFMGYRQEGDDAFYVEKSRKDVVGWLDGPIDHITEYNAERMAFRWEESAKAYEATERRLKMGRDWMNFQETA